MIMFPRPTLDPSTGVSKSENSRGGEFRQNSDLFEKPFVRTPLSDGSKPVDVRSPRITTDNPLLRLPLSYGPTTRSQVRRHARSQTYFYARSGATVRSARRSAVLDKTVGYALQPHHRYPNTHFFHRNLARCSSASLKGPRSLGECD